ncbi:MAG: hypothetical protein RMJ87_03085 [Cytophagales bacterium]|nr:hypothetical protein [Cytophagales bacterium]
MRNGDVQRRRATATRNGSVQLCRVCLHPKEVVTCRDMNNSGEFFKNLIV